MLKIAKKYGNSLYWNKCKEDGKQEKLYMNLKENYQLKHGVQNGQN